MRLTLLLTLLASVFAQADTQTDIEYARVGDTALLLDLHTPSGVKHPPLIVYVHGGAWRAGSKSDVPIAGLLDQGIGSPLSVALCDESGVCSHRTRESGGQCERCRGGFLSAANQREERERQSADKRRSR